MRASGIGLISYFELIAPPAGSGRWDTGLIEWDGTPRPAFYLMKQSFSK